FAPVDEGAAGGGGVVELETGDELAIVAAGDVGADDGLAHGRGAEVGDRRRGGLLHLLPPGARGVRGGPPTASGGVGDGLELVGEAFEVTPEAVAALPGGVGPAILGVLLAPVGAGVAPEVDDELGVGVALQRGDHRVFGGLEVVAVR